MKGLSRFSLWLILLCAVVGSMPVATQAATSEVLINHTTRSSRGEYSRTIQREINKLGSKAEQELSIPVLLGVSVRNLSKNFGDARDGGARSHEGLDIMAPRGAMVASPTDAVVTRAGEGGSAGIYVYTANPGGETFAYMHLDGIADGVKQGTVLKKGDLIGYVGNTGNASGGAPHLHFEIRKDRKALDPYPRLTKEFSTEIRIKVLTDLLAELQKELARLR